MLLDQRDKLYQCRLLHQQQYGCRDGNRIVVADHPQQNQRNQKQGNKTEIHRLRHPDQRFLRQLNHSILHFAVGQGIQRGNGTIDCFARLAYRICQSIRTDDIIADFFKIAAICIFQSSTHIVRNLFNPDASDKSKAGSVFLPPNRRRRFYLFLRFPPNNPAHRQ